MNTKENRALREKRAAIHKQMTEIAQSTDPEVMAKWTAMDAEQEGYRIQIEVMERESRSAALEAESRASGAPPNPQPDGGGNEEQARRAEKELRERAFRKYLRIGPRSEGSAYVRGIGWSDEEYKAFREARDMGVAGEGTGAATGAGVFVPVGFVQKIEEALKYYGPMLAGGEGMPEIMETATGQSLPYPTDNDTTISGELIGEGQQVTTQDVTIGQVIFGAYKFSSKLVKVSLELLQDSAFDLDAYLIKKFATRIGRATNTFFTTGSGTNQPKGIITASTVYGTAVGSVANDGVGGGNTIGTNDLTNLEHAVDPLYRMNARYMFHDSTLAAIKRLLDKYGRPIWQPAITEGNPDRINGYKYAINNDMAQLQTQASSPQVTNTTVAFGALDKYLIRRVKEISVMRLEERFADFGQIAFIAFARYDGQLLDAGTHPVQLLQNTY